jgi:hypothetical protein
MERYRTDQIFSYRGLNGRYSECLISVDTDYQGSAVVTLTDPPGPMGGDLIRYFASTATMILRLLMLEGLIADPAKVRWELYEPGDKHDATPESWAEAVLSWNNGLYFNGLYFTQAWKALSGPLGQLSGVAEQPRNTAILYEGRRYYGGPLVFVDGGHLPLRLDLRNHSPTGFDWGYDGSGPAQLALAILADYLQDDRATLTFYQDFKRSVIANLPPGDWQLSGRQIDEALAPLKADRVMVG